MTLFTESLQTACDEWRANFFSFHIFYYTATIL